MIRLLRIEARRGPTPFVLPLLAVLLGITPVFRNLTPVALWLDRSVDVAGSVQLVGPFAAGTAAWQASRGSRRKMDDLLASTARNPWTTALATWAATAGWMAAFYAALAAVYLGITAGQATWGTVLWWPVVLGLVAVLMCSLTGFAVGQWFPSRFTTPLAAVGVLAAILGVRSAAPNDHVVGVGLLSPIYPTFGLDASVFYRPQPDLAILQLLVDTGIIGLALAAMAWRARTQRPVLGPAGIALLAAGLALTATAGSLDATARNTGHGIVVPVFHSTTPAVAYTPVCSHTPLPVCVHPAYDAAREPAVLSAVINRIVRPVLGIPGMPVRAEQTDGSSWGVHGSPPVLPFDNFIMHGGEFQPAGSGRVFEALMALSLFVGPHDIRHPTAVQRALALYLMGQAHYPPDPTVLDPRAPVIVTAANRFAALTPTARTAWLTTRLAGIRAGRLTIQDIP